MQTEPQVVRIPNDGRYDEREILRYAGMRGGEAGTVPLRECLERMSGVGDARVVWLRLPVRRSAAGLSLGPLSAPSAALEKALDGCAEAVLFAATLGLAMDRLIARYSRVSPAHALLLHAIGAERIERGCNEFGRWLRLTEGVRLRPRFSPGYGDWPLAAQRGLFDLLDCERKIGLTLNESLVMSPSKSVTAVAGVEPDKEDDSYEHP